MGWIKSKRTAAKNSPITTILARASLLVGTDAAAGREEHELAAVVGLAAVVDDLDLHALPLGGALEPGELEALAAVFDAAGDGEAVGDLLVDDLRRVGGAQVAVAGVA